MTRSAATQLTIEHALLGFVDAGATHGYEIYQQLSAPAGLWQVWRMKQSQLYALLTKLEELGYLTTTLQPQEARPPRKIYALTPRGAATFHDWLTTPVANGRQMRLEFLAKLYFAQRQGPAVIDQLLSGQIAACRQWLTTFQGQNAPHADDYFAYAVQQFRLNQVDSFLTWLTTCQQALVTVRNER